MCTLTRLALQLLEDAEIGLGLRNTACLTLLAGLEQGIDVLPGTHMAIWRFLLGVDGGAMLLHRHHLSHQDVARDAVRVLLDSEVGEGGRDLALAVLRDENLAVVQDEHLLTIADRLANDGQVRRLGWLVERIHEERGLTPELILFLRDRLAASEVAAVRAAGVEIGGLLARLDRSFVVRMLADHAPPVRSAVADAMEKVEALDRPLAAAIVREHLLTETHRSVISACHYALGSLVRSSGRRVRQWEPPEGSEGN